MGTNTPVQSIFLGFKGLMFFFAPFDACIEYRLQPAGYFLLRLTGLYSTKAIGIREFPIFFILNFSFIIPHALYLTVELVFEFGTADH